MLIVRTRRNSYGNELLRFADVANYNKVYCEYYKEKFDSNNKLYKYLGTYSVTKPRKTTIKVASTTISNTNIALKKKGVDNTTTTITVVVIEISLPASQLATQLVT